MTDNCMKNDDDETFERHKECRMHYTLFIECIRLSLNAPTYYESVCVCAIELDFCKTQELIPGGKSTVICDNKYKHLISCNFFRQN